MSNPAAPEKTTALILGPDGVPASLSTVLLTGDEARLLRKYKQFLNRHHMKEAMYCEDCWEHNLQHGMEAFVTTERILFKCRCRAVYYEGPTY